MLQLWILGKGVQRNSAVTGWYFILQKPESKKNSQNASKLEPGVLLQVASFRANPWAYILKNKEMSRPSSPLRKHRSGRHYSHNG
jgi:hypothetical protein